MKTSKKHDLIQTNPHDPFAKLRQAVRELLRDLPKQHYRDQREFNNDIYALFIRRQARFPAGYTFRSLIAWATKYDYIRLVDEGWDIQPDDPKEK